MPHAHAEDISTHRPDEEIDQNLEEVINHPRRERSLAKQVLCCHHNEHEPAPLQRSYAPDEIASASGSYGFPTLPLRFIWAFEERAVPFRNHRLIV